MADKEILKKLGEETIYSAKGHFKACDIRRNLITVTIWACAILNITGLFELDPLASKVFSAIGLLGTIALLIWNEGEGKNYRSRHKETGEKYLALHKEIRSFFFLNDFAKDQLQELSRKVSQLDQSEKLEIPGFARRLAKKAIEKSDPETDNWFLRNL
jgi:hypothetical protein